MTYDNDLDPLHQAEVLQIELAVCQRAIEAIRALPYRPCDDDPESARDTHLLHAVHAFVFDMLMRGADLDNVLAGLDECFRCYAQDTPTVDRGASRLRIERSDVDGH